MGSDIAVVNFSQPDEVKIDPDLLGPAATEVPLFQMDPQDGDFVSTTFDPAACATINLFNSDSTSGSSLIGDDPATDKKKWYEKLSIRGYAQFRFNEVVQETPGSAPPSYAGDNSVDDERNFLVRRARLVLSGFVHDRVFVYLQPDFASGVPGSPDADYYTQMRDWYTDLYMTEDKVHRFRVGQSKVPFGWENMQSSQNRVPLDRNDGMNSAVRNERDLGIFYYYTPEWVQDVFKDVMDQNLKGSGNYGMFGAGIYNGQGGSFRDRNDNLHTVVRYTYPLIFSNGQIIELGIQGYSGHYVVLGSPIMPLGVGPAIIPAGTEQTGAGKGQIDQRLGGSFIMYPQPWGFQAEWNVGRGPGLNDDQTEVEARSLYGGYAMLLYKYDSPTMGTFFPFARYTHFKGGYKAYRNAPYSMMRDWELGCEWQFNKAVELTTSYLFADRTNLNAMATGESYRAFKGDVLRFQLQVNY
ncbi:MAG TPA: porin [Planctomicrobium sp.]|nr:porin [Planctomicrobium sp.]